MTPNRRGVTKDGKLHSNTYLSVNTRIRLKGRCYIRELSSCTVNPVAIYVVPDLNLEFVSFGNLEGCDIYSFDSFSLQSPE